VKGSFGRRVFEKIRNGHLGLLKSTGKITAKNLRKEEKFKKEYIKSRETEF